MQSFFFWKKEKKLFILLNKIPIGYVRRAFFFSLFAIATATLSIKWLLFTLVAVVAAVTALKKH